MIKLETKTMSKAIARAKEVRPHVTWLGGRKFLVTGSTGGRYHVEFAVANDHKLGECDCAAGKRGTMCFHICAAAAVNIAIQSAARRADKALAQREQARSLLPYRVADMRRERALTEWAGLVDQRSELYRAGIFQNSPAR